MMLRRLGRLVKEVIGQRLLLVEGGGGGGDRGHCLAFKEIYSELNGHRRRESRRWSIQVRL